MAFDTYEESIDDGQPVELYSFVGDGILVRETSAREQVDLGGGEVYVPAAITRSSIVGSSDLGADGTLTLDVPPDHPIAALFVNLVPASEILLTLREFHRGDGNLEGLWKGYVRNVT